MKNILKKKVKKKKFIIKENVSVFNSKNNYSIDGFRTLLYSGFIKGLTKTITDRLYTKYKNNIKDLFLNENWIEIQNSLLLSDFVIKKISHSWNEIKDNQTFFCMLYENGLSSFSVKKLIKLYGKNSIFIIQENPYLTMEKVGIGFKIADKIALECKIKFDDTIRIESAIFYILEQYQIAGNTYVELNEHINKTIELLSLPFNMIFNIIQELIKENKIYYLKLENNSELIANKIISEYEEEIASFFLKRRDLIDKKINFNNLTHDKKIHLKEKYSFLSDEQKNTVFSAIKSYNSIITGSAGTGKTTIIKCIYEINSLLGFTTLLIAPTGRAAQRIKEAVGCEGMTIHRAIGYRNISAYLKGIKLFIPKTNYDLIIIDEASMIDVYLIRSIIEIIGDKTRLILVGDDNQLPSIMCGNILNDLIENKGCFCFRLSKIFRQENENAIIYNSSLIASGEIPSLKGNMESDFVFISESDKEIGFKKICEIASNYYDEKSNKLLIYIISCMNKGTTGTIAINNELQNICREKKNISKETIKIVGKFYILDRVMQIKNNYDLHVFNGEIGIIIEGEYSYCKVQFEDKIVEYDSLDAFYLSLAYAITTHKSQGSEFPIILIPIYMEHYLMLGRKNLYTAITRASSKCILIGEKRSLICAIKKDGPDEKRNTLLKIFLQKSS